MPGQEQLEWSMWSRSISMRFVSCSGTMGIRRSLLRMSISPGLLPFLTLGSFSSFIRTYSMRLRFISHTLGSRIRSHNVSFIKEGRKYYRGQPKTFTKAFSLFNTPHQFIANYHISQSQ